MGRAMDALRGKFDPDAPEPPVHPKTDKVQYLPHWKAHAWVLYHAAWPLAVHQILARVLGRNLRAVGVFWLYTIAFNVNAGRQLDVMQKLGSKYGFLDGDVHARDEVPAGKVAKIWSALISTSTLRPLIMTYLAYTKKKLPSSIFSWWTPLTVGVYPIILDFFFYWYHRMMHEKTALWKYHRTHHLTKHPTPLLTLYADGVQEAFDIAGIPLMTYATMRAIGFPMGFYEFWLCNQYIVFTELFGHSGIRLWVTPPTTATPLLKLLKAEIVTEDHDLHHRRGWRKAINYGKQTMLWDRLFGTLGDRIELEDDNVDWDKPADMGMRFPYF